MTAGELQIILDEWKTDVEPRCAAIASNGGRDFPPDGDLSELVMIGVDYESARIRRAAEALYRELPPAIRTAARLSGWYSRIQKLLEGR